MEQQRLHQEDRVRRALERAQAEPKKKVCDEVLFLCLVACDTFYKVRKGKKSPNNFALLTKLRLEQRFAMLPLRIPHLRKAVKKISRYFKETTTEKHTPWTQISIIFAAKMF